MKATLLLSIACFFLFEGLSQSTQLKIQRKIDVTIPSLKDKKIFLGTYLGEKKILSDSCILDKNGQGSLANERLLTKGIYFLVTPSLNPFLEILLDDKQRFKITVHDTLSHGQVIFENSIVNDQFKNYTFYSNQVGATLRKLADSLPILSTSPDSAILLTKIQLVADSLQAYRDALCKANPTSLLTLLLKSANRPSFSLKNNQRSKQDTLLAFRHIRDHYWDDVSFSEDFLLHTPFFEPKLDDYFKYYVSHEPDSIIEEVKYILLSARAGKEIYPYLLTKFTNKYINPEYMGQDKVFVYLFENFYAKGDTIHLNPSSRKTVIERAYSLMANQLGKPAPVLSLTDTSGKIIPLQSLKSEFTVVAFWDPNCGHCKDEIPRLDSFYRSKWKAMGVVIYGVNVSENEIPAWKRFIVEKKLTGWVHTYQTKAAKENEDRAGIPNYRQLYDVFKTPTLYLLDKHKRIIAKQLSLEQFNDLITIKVKGN